MIRILGSPFKSFYCLYKVKAGSFFLYFSTLIIFGKTEFNSLFYFPTLFILEDTKEEIRWLEKVSPKYRQLNLNFIKENGRGRLRLARETLWRHLDTLSSAIFILLL